jgi:EpsI family protein
MPKFLTSAKARVLTAVLVLQCAVLYGFQRRELVPSVPPLATFPTMLSGWRMVEEGVIEKEVQDVLKADDTLSRTYAGSTGSGANLFIAAFRSQRNGKAPHSPKNCLPGSGWVPSVSDRMPIQVPGREQPIVVNRYIVQKGEYASLVLYWYQSRDRVVASEYNAKFYVVADALKDNRTDTALVRVIVPVAGKDQKAATETAVKFVQDMFGAIRASLPA